MTPSEPVPAVPVSCAARPTVGAGLVVPWVNTALADGGVDFRSQHHTKAERCWTECLCQVCGGPTGRPVVLFGGPAQLAARRFDEPPLCLPCARYTAAACPMVAGRLPRYADRTRVSEGRRGKTCTEPGCGCGGWTPTDPTLADYAGAPAHPWYAVYIDPAAYAVLVYRTTVRCSDRGCEHDRVVVSGGQLTADPLRVVLVSTPEQGPAMAMTPPPITAGYTADQLEQVFHAALTAGDARGVEAALTLMTATDPRRAVELYDDLKTALAIAKVIQA